MHIADLHHYKTAGVISMTPAEFKEARQRLGLSASAMALAIGLAGKNAGRTVRRYEAGDAAVTGPVTFVTLSLLDGYTPPGWPVSWPDDDQEEEEDK